MHGQEGGPKTEEKEHAAEDMVEEAAALVSIAPRKDENGHEKRKHEKEHEKKHEKKHKKKHKKRHKKRHKKKRRKNGSDSEEDDDEEELSDEELLDIYEQELAQYAAAPRKQQQKTKDLGSRGHRHSSSASKSYLDDQASDEDAHSSDEDDEDDAASDVGEDGHVMTVDRKTGEKISLVVPDDEAEAIEKVEASGHRELEALERELDFDGVPDEMPETVKRRLKERQQQYETEKKEAAYKRAARRRLQKSSMDHYLKRRTFGGNSGATDSSDEDSDAGEDDDGFIAHDDDDDIPRDDAAQELPEEEEATEEEARAVVEAISARDPISRKRKQRERRIEALRRLSKRRKGKEKAREDLPRPLVQLSSGDEEEDDDPQEAMSGLVATRQTKLCLLPSILSDGEPPPKSESKRRFEQLMRYWVCAELDGRFVDSLWKQQSGLNAAPASSMFKTKSAKTLLRDVEQMTTSRKQITGAVLEELGKLTEASAPDSKFAYLIFYASYLSVKYTRYEGKTPAICPISGREIRCNDEVMLLAREPPRERTAAASGNASSSSPAEKSPRHYLYIRKAFGLKVHMLIIYVHWESFTTGIIESRIRNLPTMHDAAYSDKVLRLLEQPWLDYMYETFSSAEMFVVRQLDNMSGGRVKMYPFMMGKYKP